MKTLNLISVIAITVIAMVITSCDEGWNDHYKEKQQVIDNENVVIVDANIVDFLQSESSLSSVLSLFNETGMIDVIKNSTQSYTILVVNNDVSIPDGIDNSYLARTHMAAVSLSPSYIHNGDDGRGMRLNMLNKKNLTIKRDDTNTDGYSFYFNEIKVNRVIKTNNGYIYELDKYIESPPSLIETIYALGDEYSVFRQMIIDKATRTFDKAASLPLWVDVTGNTVYDSIFIETFPYFEAKGFDITSEDLKATMLVPNNDLVNNAIALGKQYLELTGLQRHDTILENWVFQAALFNKMYEPEDFENTVDLTSAFGKQWRTTVQQIDYSSRDVMSNGLNYKVTHLQLPVNLLIYRLKDYMHYYELMTAEEKLEYFKETNLIYNKTATEVTEWSGWPSAGFPNIINRVVYFKLDSIGQENGEYKLEFTAVRCVDNGDGSYTMKPFGIPPGEYEVCFGFKEYKNPPADRMPGSWDIYFNDEYQMTIPQADLLTTRFHYDRNGQGYPEGYNSSIAVPTPGGKAGNYDRDGGKVGEITITGEGPQPVKFTFHGKNLGANADIIFHHWCLRPTKNCY